MAFSYVIDTEIVRGINGQMITGTYANTGGSTGGTISFPVMMVKSISIQPMSSIVNLAQSVVGLTWQNFSPNVPIITSANEVGTFIAICK
jgi:hypothetical protein